ncbi:MAG: PIN domain-containing protein, partial [Actinomycetota bacterium]|nr:PIN domain-containing protein [Actinomycetota bacterium]
SRGLNPPDALVYSSVLSHLRSSAPPQGAPSCFVTRDRDFTDANIESDLARLGCKILFKFEDGLGYVRSRLP